MSRNILVSLAGAAVLTIATTFGASAVTCNISEVEHSTACIGPSVIGSGGSASASDLATLDGGGWSEVVKIEDGVTSTLFSASLGATSGTYTIFGPMANFDYAIGVKGGAFGRGVKKFAAYLLTADSILNNKTGANLTGSFSMAALVGGASSAPGIPGLSNAVLFKRPGTPSAEVPLPAAGGLLLLGLGGLAVMRRRSS